MSCNLNKVVTGKLKFPKLSIPGISRPDLGIKPPDSTDLDDIQKCFEWDTPFGGKIKPPKKLGSLQGKIPQTIATGLEVLQQIMSALMPFEALTQVVKPIADVLKALDGETDPATIVSKLVELADTLLSLVSLFTDTYPLLLLSDILNMIQCICKVVSQLKDFLIAVTKFIDQVNTAILQVAGQITTSITKAITDKVSKSAQSITGLDSSKQSFSDNINELMDVHNLDWKKSNAYIGYIIGGPGRLVADGLTEFKDDVASPSLKGGYAKTRNFLIQNPDKSDDSNKGISGPIANFLSVQQQRIGNLRDSEDTKLQKKQDRNSSKVDGLKANISAQLPSLEDCFSAALQDLGTMVTKFSSTLQTLMQNLVEAAIKNIGSMLTGLIAPILGAIPQCP